MLNARLHFVNNASFYCILPKNITDKFITNQDVCKFLQICLISSMRFEKKLGHTDLNLERMYLCMIDLVRNDWKHILRNETSQKFLFKTLCYNNQGT